MFVLALYLIFDFMRCVLERCIMCAYIQTEKYLLQRYSKKTSDKSNPHEYASKKRNPFFCESSLHLFFIKDQIKTNKSREKTHTE